MKKTIVQLLTLDAEMCLEMLRSIMVKGVRVPLQLLVFEIFFKFHLEIFLSLFRHRALSVSSV